MTKTKTRLSSLLKSVKNFLLIALMLQTTCGFSQTRYIDSLRRNVQLAKDDQQKLAAVFALCDEANSLHPDTLYKYAELANTIAVRDKSADAVIQSGLYKAMYFSRKGQFYQAEKLIDSSLLVLKNF